MLGLLFRWLIGILALYITAVLIRGISIERTASAAIFVGVISIVNVVIRPVFFLLTLPFTLVTLGLFIFILNGLMFILAAEVVKGFTVDSFWEAVLGAFVFSLVNSFLLEFFSPLLYLI